MKNMNDKIKSVLVIGSGPIIIGQGCEFDYSGTQACLALKEEGKHVLLLNSNPATIMTDTHIADDIFIDPVRKESVISIIENNKVDAIITTIGGQLALNISVELFEDGILDKYDVKLIGANIDVIRLCEDRQLFKECVLSLDSYLYADVAKSFICNAITDLDKVVKSISYPMIIRPSFTLGGAGGGVANNKEELIHISESAFNLSPNHQILIEESLIGWQEFELELARDKEDNVIVICGMENIDPVGVHTGDSISVAPIITLMNKDYQRMRNIAIALMRKININSGGCNIQFAFNPDNGNIKVIEMNPRVSRSSALASKATGYPIAKISTKLALGYTLPEIMNDITKTTVSSFEPTIDYIVVKIPKFNFEKFPGAETELTTSMKSIGEVMGIGSSFIEALQKALASLESNEMLFNPIDIDVDMFIEKLKSFSCNRLQIVFLLLYYDVDLNYIASISYINKWFLYEIKKLVTFLKGDIKNKKFNKELLFKAKLMGVSDQQIANILNTKESNISFMRKVYNINPVYRRIDTCAGEFESYTYYYYSTYIEWSSNTLYNELNNIDQKFCVIIGSGPNRIGQGIEFDYSCVNAVFVLKRMGYKVVMINSNPETVSTDYNIADYLFFEPLDSEHIINIVNSLKNDNFVGVFVQFGGQTSIQLADDIASNNIPLIGVDVNIIDIFEDRNKFSNLLTRLNIPVLQNGYVEQSSIISSIKENSNIAVNKGDRFNNSMYDDILLIIDQIGYPVLIRPSYVIGGKLMAIIYNHNQLKEYIDNIVDKNIDFKGLLIDKFLEGALELDVDVISDGKDIFIVGISEHIEEAGIHSGDSTCILPPITLGKKYISKIYNYLFKIVNDINFKGFLNMQCAIYNDVLYILEINPRASRTLPFVSKVSNINILNCVINILLKNSTIRELINSCKLPVPIIDNKQEKGIISVKSVTIPWNRFMSHDKYSDVILGPEMHSTGEVMGTDINFSSAYLKAQLSLYDFQQCKNIFISIADRDKINIIFPMHILLNMGYKIYATHGTADILRRQGINVNYVGKYSDPQEGELNVIDMIHAGKIDLIINTPFGRSGRLDGQEIRLAALRYNIPCVTTVRGFTALALSLQYNYKNNLCNIQSLNSYRYAYMFTEDGIKLYDRLLIS